MSRNALVHAKLRMTVYKNNLKGENVERTKIEINFCLKRKLQRIL